MPRPRDRKIIAAFPVFPWAGRPAVHPGRADNGVYYGLVAGY